MRRSDLIAGVALSMVVGCGSGGTSVTADAAQPTHDALGDATGGGDVAMEAAVDASLDVPAADTAAPGDVVDATVVDAATDARADVAVSCGTNEYSNNGVCAPVTACTAAEYQTAAPTPTTNRVCAAVTVCAAGTSVMTPPTATTNRVCAPCAMGTFSTTTNAATCATWTTCAAGLVQSVAPTATNDRVCNAPGGAFDTTFGSALGWVRYFPNVWHNEWFGVVANPDSTLVLAGRDQVGPADEDWVVSKLTVAGALDPAFGTGGHLRVSRGAVLGERAMAMRAASDGTYFVAGQLMNSATGFDFAVAHVTAVGGLDAAYGTAGVALRAVAGDDNVEGMHLYADGSVLAIGRTGSGTSANMLFVKFTPTGALDTTFGTGGVVTYGAAGVDDEALDVAVDSTGATFVVGFSGDDSVILKLMGNGALDSTFGTNGARVVDLGRGTPDELREVEIGAGNTVVAAGTTNNGTASSDFVVTRFSSAGVPDTTFGTAGVVILSGSGMPDTCYALRLAPDGKILFGGRTGLIPYVGRLTTTGALDASFGTAGVFTGNFGGSSSSYVNDINLDVLGRIILCGPGGMPNPDFCAARLTP